MDRVIAAALYPVRGRRGSVLQMPRVEHVGATELRAAGVTQWMWQRQAAVQNGGGFLRKNLSALDDQLWSNMSGKVQKASWLGVEDIHEDCRVDLHSSLVGDMRDNFHAMPDDRAVFVMLVGLLKAWGNGSCSCWTTWHWSWVLQRAAVVLQVSTTLVARSVASLLPRSPSLSSDGSRLRLIGSTSHLVQSVTVEECIPMLINVGRLQHG